jgi:hypothetical protein
VGELAEWVQVNLPRGVRETTTAPILVLAANDETRRKLGDRLSLAIRGSYPLLCKTPLGFIGDEVFLFWPLIFEKLHLKAQFPLKLRPEMEQDLATTLAREQGFSDFKPAGVSEYRFIRQTLDILQLAGLGGYITEEIPTILSSGLYAEEQRALSTDLGKLGEFLQAWCDWCLERGLLTYGIISQLYSHYLLPDFTYQNQLNKRYGAVFADDLDDYPAIAADLLEYFLEQGKSAVFTYNPQGQIRLGLGADPQHLAQISDRCQQITLKGYVGLAKENASTLNQVVSASLYLTSLPPCFSPIQSISRAQLLSKISTSILDSIHNQEIEPQDIVIIAPGLDEIARYSLMENLTAGGLRVNPLNEQRPLISSPLVRALLTLLGLVYSGLGRLLSPEAIAEMLVILSCSSIDPVRAGLLADYCYQVDLDYPRLLPVTAFSRWDRLGYQATTAYETLRAWVENSRTALVKEKLTPLMLLDRAIRQLIGDWQTLTFAQTCALRELSETAQHFWEVDRQMRQNSPSFRTPVQTVAEFIELLRRGTLTANPYPVKNLGEENAVMLATIFQYRSLRTAHRWQFWLDVASPLWEKGGAATLVAAPLFLRQQRGIWGEEESLEADKDRLERILADLLSRATEKVILCHSDLSISGSEQLGPLLPLVQMAFG